MEDKAKDLKNRILELAREYYREAKPDARRKGYVPVSGKVLGEEELCNMLEASLDMWLTTGRFNTEFEREFASFIGSRFALTTTSGSSANLLAVTALTSPKLGDRRLKPGDEVITVACGFPTTVNPIIQNGLIPVFVDVDLGTYNINIAEMKAALTGKTRAVFIAHTLGNVFDLEEISKFCSENNLWLIEDSCDALGAKYDGKYVGTYGHIGTFSFYPAHHITMGEGGACCTDDPALYKIIMSLRDWGRDCWCKPGVDDTCKNRFSDKVRYGKMPLGYDHKYIYSHVGYNLKITDYQAACGLAQLKRLPGFIEARNKNFSRLLDGLGKFSEYFIFPKFDGRVSPSWFGFILTVKDGAPFGKNEIVKFLEANGIGTRSVFAGNVLRQPLYANGDIKLRIKGADLKVSNALSEEDFAMLPNTEKVMESTFWLGVWPGLSSGDLDYIISKVSEFVESKR